VERLLADTERLVLPAGVTLEKTFTAEQIGVDGPLAGAQFSRDGGMLYVVGGAGAKKAAVYELAVRREPGTRAISALAAPRRVCDAANADGGLTQSGDGTFYWSTWRAHELGQFATGSAAPKRFPLDASGAPPGGGGLAFVPRGTDSGALLLSSYADGGIYRLELSEPVDGARTPIPGSAKLVARVPRGIEGLRFMPGGRDGGRLLVRNWDAGAISALAVDARTGLPVVDEDGVAEPRNFIGGVAAASGLDFDPVTGALLVTAWGSGNRIQVFSGFPSPESR
jgi:hypothetical protein